MFIFLLAHSRGSGVYKTCDNKECNDEIKSKNTFKKGDSIAVTAIFTGYDNKQGTDPIKRYTRFYPKVDKLAILQLQDGNCTLTNMYNSTLQLKVGNLTTNLWAYRPEKSPDVVTQFFSAQIEMELGVVTAVNFDTLFDQNSCKQERLPYRCAVKRSVDANCTENVNIIKTFLAFAGTDSDKVPLESREYLPSTFLKFGVGNIVDDAVELFNKGKEYVTDLVG